MGGSYIKKTIIIYVERYIPDAVMFSKTETSFCNQHSEEKYMFILFTGFNEKK